MTALQNVPDAFQYVSVLVAVVAGICILYWRIVLRIVATMIIVLIALGAAMIIHGIQYLAR
jgi:hypothetical protein